MNYADYTNVCRSMSQSRIKAERSEAFASSIQHIIYCLYPFISLLFHKNGAKKSG